MVIRRQLTLFVAAGLAAAIEAVRRRLDPVQHRLIAAHVTLCREDELTAWTDAGLSARLADLRLPRITLRFGAPETFSEHGVLLPCIDGEDGFRELRERILGTSDIRRQSPHITLAHPRNPRAAGNQPGGAATLRDLAPIRFDAIQFIEQADGDPWRVLQRFDLPG